MNRYLAACGLGSRRSVEAIILAGKVSINGSYVHTLATAVEEGDDVRVSGRRISPPKTLTVIAMNKPVGYLSTRSDERGRETIYHLLPEHFRRLFPIGRLDKDSEGLMLLTDDGDLAQKLSHPTRKVEKEYDVSLESDFDQGLIPKLQRGFVIEGGRARMESVRMIGSARVKVVLTQGLKRQIRLMFYRLGYEVKRLSRIRIGTAQLGNLRTGEWKALGPKDIERLQAVTKNRQDSPPPNRGRKTLPRDHI
ncbi:MAG: pseudouridine synthase [Terrimicrobiaceae bacterium]